MKNLRKYIAAVLAMLMLSAVALVPASAKTAGKTVRVGDKLTVTAYDLNGAKVTLDLGEAGIHAETFRAYKDVSYDKDATSENQYDLYIPASVSENGKGSLLVMIHGGGYNEGSKDMEPFCLFYAAAGYIVANVNYRLTEKYNSVSLLDMDEDLYKAVAHIKKNLTKKGIVCEEMATHGYSAGGGLSLTYAYKHRNDSPIPVKFVSAGSAPVDFTSDAWIGSFSISSKQDAAEYITGDRYKETDFGSGSKGEKALLKNSPMTYLDKNSVPTLLLYGENDLIVPTHQKDAFLKKLDKVGIHYELITKPCGTHVTTLLSADFAGWMMRTLNWCELYFTD